ncbi:glycoside hydrolase family 65 protein [Microbacterium trichothecenolyticum]|uniref:Glycoside hydrolase family 65 protein n=1 Tax=Microbacterium ureisolvens TaxID=2781186 RepID=A0ABS7I2I2_9MICO|nr:MULTISPECIES: glycosyl hydrolase family 65 protein [Microbacterium]MBW9111528.1 glycoside hydrolase family 65 protein [Microbacterium ureisolvens]MBW9121770.1 glycoside hydrolase family 65 protein [Microbacterium trichothecenolyticum]
MIDRDRFPVDPWRLVETSFQLDDAGVTETLFAVGNGYLGLRGNQPEGRHAHEHGTFINGFHETFPIRHAEQAYGFAEVGQTIINAPDAKVMRVYVDDEPLSLDVADVREYERVLDMRDGVQRRHILWVTPSGKEVRIDYERLVSFEEKHLALMTVDVTVLNADAPVTVSCQILNRQDGEDVYGGTPSAPRKAGFDPRKTEKLHERVLQPQEYWQDKARSALSYRATDSGMTIAVVADHLVETANEYTSRTLIEPDIAKNVFRVDAKAGVPIRVTKLVSYHTSRGVPARELVDRCRRTLDRALGESVDAIRAQQREWLDAFWERSDVRIGGHDDLQQATRWCLFQLAQAAARADGQGVPAKGMTGSGYSGHYFWDTEIYVLPFLAYTTPLWARNALRMRYLMLPAARRRAFQLNEAGALFPWRTINGEEASAYYAAGTAQYHINADVSFALAKYVRATGDNEFLFREGVDIAVETARLWATLGFWRSSDGVLDGEGDTFHIHGVTGPDEYTTVVNDNLFTNVMARFNLRFAARTIREMAELDGEVYRQMVDRLALEPGEPEAWERAAEAMHIPFSPSLGIHPQDHVFLEREIWDLENTPPDKRPLLLHFHPLVIYRYQVLKQADVVLALFLQGNHFSDEDKLADFEYYDPLTTGDSTLSAVVQSILAAEVGYQDLALEYFRESIFVDLGDLHHNASDGVHVASAGGVWTALVAGFGGMRDHFGELSFDPRLPASWPSLEFVLHWHGTRLVITVTRDELRVRAVEGEPVGFSVRGVGYVVGAGEEVVAPLDGQGPVIPGRPSLRELGDARREDGSLLSASVPTVTSTIPIIVGAPADIEHGADV